MLQAIAKMYRRYLPVRADSERFAEFVDRLDQTSWERLLQNIPADITQREPIEFGRFAWVDAHELASAAGLDI